MNFFLGVIESLAESFFEDVTHRKIFVGGVGIFLVLASLGSFYYFLGGTGSILMKFIHFFALVIGAAVVISAFFGSAGEAAGGLFYSTSRELDKTKISSSLLHKASGLISAGHYYEAEEAYKEIIEMTPNDPMPWYRLGRLYEKGMNDPEKALGAYEEAWEIVKRKKVKFQYTKDLRDSVADLREMMGEEAGDAG